MTIRITKKDIDAHLARRIREISGENITACMQCGTCGGVCPMYEQVNTPPRVLVMLAQLGLAEQLEEKRSYDVCASCHHCQVRCPRGLDLPKVMEALRLLTLRKNINLLELDELDDEAIRDMPQIALVAALRKLTA